MLRLACVVLLTTSCLQGGDVPATFADVARMECEWITALRGLHVRYAVSQDVPPVGHGQKSAVALVAKATTETWIDTNGQRYRYETHVDHEQIQNEQKRLTELSATPIDAEDLPDIFTDAILVRTPFSSEYLPLSTGKMVMSWRLPDVLPNGGPIPYLATEEAVQPLFKACVLHQLQSEGWCPSGEGASLFAPVPTFQGVVFAKETCVVAGDHVTLSALVTFPNDLPDFQMQLSLSMVKLGQPARWFIERITASQPNDEHIGSVTTITWRSIPGSPFVAVPEHFVSISTRIGRVTTDIKATLVEANSPIPKEVWSIDQNLAKSIYDSNDRVMLMPEAR